MSFLINPFAFAVAGGDFESIATVTVGSGGASTASFTSIPQTYQHLQVRFLLNNGTYNTLDDTSWRFNSDSGSNYTRHQIRGNGASATAAGSTGLTFAGLGVHGASATSFTGGIVDILDYASTSKNKTIRSFHGYDANGSGDVLLRSSLWLDANAISSITVGVASGNLAEYSTFALYGIKAP